MGHIITALEPQKRNPNRVNVHLDGVFAFSLSRIVAAWLSVGREMSDAEIVKIQRTDDNEKAIQTALRYIAFKPRTAAEVRKKLAAVKYPEAVIENAIVRLTQNGLINDGQYAQAWIRERQDLHPRSIRQMEFELRQKGIGREDIDAALVGSAEDDQMAYQLAHQKLNRYTSLDFSEFRIKLGGMLARRGFSYDTIARVINRLWSERKTGITQD